jgi:holo-[acyl-carrier protein] synthase
MISGIGCDIVSIDRIIKASQNPKFARRILSVRELVLYDQLTASQAYSFLAGRFAAKEAFSKAMGCGIGGTLSWRDISISNNDRGRPQLSCSLLNGQDRCHLSIAHEVSYAVAYCVIESNCMGIN